MGIAGFTCVIVCGSEACGNDRLHSAGDSLDRAEIGSGASFNRARQRSKSSGRTKGFESATAKGDKKDRRSASMKSTFRTNMKIATLAKRTVTCSQAERMGSKWPFVTSVNACMLP